VPAQVLPRSNAAPGLLAHLITAKYVDSLPLHRQETIFARGCQLLLDARQEAEEGGIRRTLAYTRDVSWLGNRRLPRGGLVIKIPEGDPTHSIIERDRRADPAIKNVGRAQPALAAHRRPCARHPTQGSKVSIYQGQWSSPGPPVCDTDASDIRHDFALDAAAVPLVPSGVDVAPEVIGLGRTGVVGHAVVGMTLIRHRRRGRPGAQRGQLDTRSARWCPMGRICN